MHQPLHILLVEDNPGDVRLTVEALKDSKILHRLDVARDGVEALRQLREAGPNGSPRRPDLILLDLKLPKKDGQEVLAEIKSDEQLSAIPVIVLTSSNDERDVLRAYEHHANSYVVKPLDAAGLVAVLRSIEEFWLSVVKLPRGAPHA